MDQTVAVTTGRRVRYSQRSTRGNLDYITFHPRKLKELSGRAPRETISTVPS